MKIEIREGYDVVITAENERERKRLGKLYDKWAAQGTTVDLVGAPGFHHQVTIRPQTREEKTTELGG